MIAVRRPFQIANLLFVWKELLGLCSLRIDNQNVGDSRRYIGGIAKSRIIDSDSVVKRGCRRSQPVPIIAEAGSIDVGHVKHVIKRESGPVRFCRLPAK